MAIKIDLEKAYDRLSWQFVVDSSRYLGLNDHFLSIIWHYILSSFMNVLWNGEHTGEFSPRMGIRQGDPLSPYLFVICIERLSHLIQMAIEQNLWKPINISIGGLDITHLCFVDDLFIFTEASM